MAKYLDSTGVATLWQKCKDTFGTVKTVNGTSPDANGNVNIAGTWQTDVTLNKADLEAMKNKIYRIDGQITFMASAGSTNYQYLRNGIFKITGVSTSGSSSTSQHSISASIYISVIAAGRGTSNAAVWSDYSASSSGTGYGYGSTTAKYTGILTELN